MEKQASTPNVKAFNRTIEQLDEILDIVDGYVDNKKVLLAVAVNRLYDEFLVVDKRRIDDIEKFVEKILAEIHHMIKNGDIDVKVRNIKGINHE